MPGADRRAAGSLNPSSGLVVSPFRALRYTTSDPSVLAGLTSPAYDLIDPESRAALERTNPNNVVGLILPRSPGRTETTEASRAVPHAKAAALLRRWRRQGVLRVDERPALYVYEMTDAHTVTRGFLATVDLDPGGRVILPHEDVMPGPVADRLELLRHTHANFEPIVLVHEPADGATAVAEAATHRRPDVEMTGEDGVRHAVWTVADPADQTLVAAALAERNAVIADGHHRYASYLRHQADQHAAGHGAGPWDRALAYLVPLGLGGLRVEAIHRVLRQTSLASARAAAAAAFDLRDIPAGLDAALSGLAAADGTAVVLTDGTGWVLAERNAGPVADDGTASATWRRLDIVVVERLLLRALTGGDDPDRVLVAHDAGSAVTLARRNQGTAVLLRPTDAASVLSVARHHERMPRKSTLFVPKPRTGLVMRCYSDEAGWAAA